MSQPTERPLYEVLDEVHAAYKAHRISREDAVARITSAGRITPDGAGDILDAPVPPSRGWPVMTFLDHMFATTTPGARDAMQAQLNVDAASDAAVTGVWWSVYRADGTEVERYTRQYLAEYAAADNADATGNTYDVRPVEG